MSKHSIIIDCDPGQDDAIAILLALASPEIDVVAITVVAGNVPLSLTEKNARKMVELSGRTDVPVHAGCARPIMQPLTTAEEVHGESGLDGPELPEPTMPLAEEHAVDTIIRIVRERPAKSITLVPVGPLTNIALALIKAPDIVDRIQHIALMGGALELGNVTPAAEFNIYVDPHAARVVFESGIPITMFGLDVTHKALVTHERIERIQALDNRVAINAAALLNFFSKYDLDRYHMGGAPLHDPCPIAWLINPALFSGKQCNVVIETDNTPSIGRTVVDWWGATDGPRNATVITEIDCPAFYDLLTERLARYASN